MDTVHWCTVHIQTTLDKLTVLSNTYNQELIPLSQSLLLVENVTRIYSDVVLDVLPVTL